MLREIFWIVLSIPSALAMAEFLVPGPPPYPSWKAGEVQQIRYRTTYTEYTIALWQQLDGAANLGPILFQTTKGPDSEFDWVVQNYDLELNTSNKFFLWLFEGDPSVQGNTSIKNSQSSGFFYISTASTNSSSPSTSSTIPSSTPTTSDVSQNKSSAASGGLSPGAKAGIGVGAGVAGLAAVSAILLFVKYRSKKKKELDELRFANLNRGGPPSSDMSKPVFPFTTVAQQAPSELLANHDRPVAELG